MISTPYSWRADGERNHASHHPEQLITYKLPMTVVDLTATYEIRHCGAGRGALDDAIALVSVTSTSSVRAETASEYWYDVDTAHWSGFAVALQEAKLELSDGILTSVNFRSEAQVSQVIAGAVRIAGLGGSVLGGGQAGHNARDFNVPCSSDTRQALRRRSDLHRQIEDVEGLIRDANTSNIDILTANAQHPYQPEAAKNEVERRTRLTALRDDLLKSLLALRDGPLRFSVVYSWMPGGGFQNFPLDNTVWNRNREIVSRFEPDADVSALLAFTVDAAPFEPTPRVDPHLGRDRFSGVYYRTPVRAHVTVARDGHSIGLPDISVLQFGSLRTLPISGSPFVNRSRGATWQNGSLASVTAGANGATGPAVLGVAGDIADAQRSVELAHIQRETAEYQAMTALANAREAYEETVTVMTPAPPSNH